MTNVAYILSRTEKKPSKSKSHASLARRHAEQQFLDFLPAAIDSIKEKRMADAKELRKFIRACE